MNGLLNWISKTSSLWMLLAATVLLTYAFQFLAGQLGIVFIDNMSSPDDAMAAIAGFTADQRSAHAWITGTVDVAYPLAYGLFFAGTALHFFPNAGRYLCWPLLAVIPVDLLEGLVQIMALIGNDGGIGAKAILTPLKFGLLLAGLAIAIAGWLRWLWL